MRLNTHYFNEHSTLVPVGYSRDNPGGSWLREKQEDAFSGGGSSARKGLRGTPTAYAGMSRALYLPVSKLIKLKGVMNENRRPGDSQYDELLESVKARGYTNETPIMVFVNHLGQAFINEGNTRIAVAHDLGIPYIQAWVHWYNGAEDVEGSWSPASVAKMQKTRLLRVKELSLEENFDERKHPRLANGEFAPKNEGEEPGTKTAKLSPAHEDREKWPDHIKSLKLPPAWTNVHVSHDPNADLLAIGKDAKGRAQYVYSKRFAESQAAIKFARISELNEKFDEITKQISRLRRSKNPRIQDHADCTHLIMTMGLRPGSEEDTGAEVRAHGATTLEGRHVVKDGKTVRLQFVGKKGVNIDVPVDDPATAKMLLARAQTAGQNGQLFATVRAKSLLDFVHALGDGGFKTKDMRTLVATRLAHKLVNELEKPSDERAYKKQVLHVAKQVAQKLGNTPSIALSAYISPFVFSGWRQDSSGAQQ